MSKTAIEMIDAIEQDKMADVPWQYAYHLPKMGKRETQIPIKSHIQKNIAVLSNKSNPWRRIPPKIPRQSMLNSKSPSSNPKGKKNVKEISIPRAITENTNCYSIMINHQQ